MERGTESDNTEVAIRNKRTEDWNQEVGYSDFVFQTLQDLAGHKDQRMAMELSS